MREYSQEPKFNLQNLKCEKEPGGGAAAFLCGHDQGERASVYFFRGQAFRKKGGAVPVFGGAFGGVIYWNNYQMRKNSQ